MLEIVLPWPDKALSPNARLHWAKVGKAKKAAREIANIYTRRALEGGVAPPKDGGIIYSNITLYPPTRARRDMDNALASLKAYHDGIADALGVNDCRFGIVPQAWGDSEKGGKVVIRLEWEAAQ